MNVDEELKKHEEGEKSGDQIDEDELKEVCEKHTKEEEKERKPPSVEAVRERLRDMVKYLTSEYNDQFKSIFPMLEEEGEKKSQGETASKYKKLASIEFEGTDLPSQLTLLNKPKFKRKRPVSSRGRGRGAKRGRR